LQSIISFLWGLIIFGFIFLGIKNYLSVDDSKLKELSIGLIVTGIGTIGLLKSGIEATKSYIERQKTTGNNDNRCTTPKN